MTERCFDDGWFDTGDLAVMDSDNNIRLTDRAKDVIKSGGEWISSIDIENVVAGMPWRIRSSSDRRSAPEVGRAAIAGRGTEARD